MKITKIFAGIAACAVSVSALAITSLAGSVSYTGTVAVDSSSDDTKMVQITYADLGIPADAVAITNISFDVNWDCTTAYWAGGGGSVGIQANSDESTGWVQYDMTAVPEDYTVTSWSESIDFPADGQDIASVYADGFVQFGWWWGADPSVEITNIVVTYTGGTQEVTTTTAATTTTVAETTTTVAETTTTAAETTTVAETTTTVAETTTTVAETTTAVETTTTAATTAADTSPVTGVEGVASVAALLTLAGAAVAVAKKH